MHREGHMGLTMLLFSLAMLPIGYSQDGVVLIVLAGAVSFIPDLDIEYGIPHRTYTHNILAALILGTIAGVLGGYYGDLRWGAIGFLALFGGIMSHLLGDAITYMKFKPLWPFSHREVAWGFFKSSDAILNRGFFYAGFGGLILYIMNGTGALQTILG